MVELLLLGGLLGTAASMSSVKESTLLGNDAPNLMNKAPDQPMEALPQDIVLTENDPGAPTDAFYDQFANFVPDNDEEEDAFAVPDFTGPPRLPIGYNREPAEESPEAILRGAERIMDFPPNPLGKRMGVDNTVNLRDPARAYMQDNKRWLSRTDVAFPEGTGLTSAEAGDKKSYAPRGRMPITCDYGKNREVSVEHLPPAPHRHNASGFTQQCDFTPVRDTVSGPVLPLRGEKHTEGINVECRGRIDERAHWRTEAAQAAWAFPISHPTYRRTQDTDPTSLRGTQREQLVQPNNLFRGRTFPYHHNYDIYLRHVARETEGVDQNANNQARFPGLSYNRDAQQRETLGLVEVDQDQVRPPARNRIDTTTAVRAEMPEEDDRLYPNLVQMDDVDDLVGSGGSMIAENPYGNPLAGGAGGYTRKGR